MGSISSVWPCQGGEKRSILVEQRIKFKKYTYSDAEKIHVSLHGVIENITSVSRMKHVFVSA